MAVIAFYLLIKVNQSITSPNNYNASLNECLNLHWLIAKEEKRCVAVLFNRSF